MSEVIELLQRGVTLFEKLTGVSRDKTSGKFTLGEFDSRRQIDALDEALSLDASGVTALLLLRFYTESYVAGRTFSWLDLLRKPELASQLDVPREILSVIESDIVKNASDHMGLLAALIISYGFELKNHNSAACLESEDSFCIEVPWAQTNGDCVAAINKACTIAAASLWKIRQTS